MTQLTGLKFVSDEESENPIERQKRLAVRLEREEINRRRYVRRYTRIANEQRKSR